MYVRISRGHFEPARCEEIDRLLRESGDTLIPAIRRLAGNRHYYAAIDCASATMVNVSVWDTLAHAQQMATLPEMRALAEVFSARGVRFETIINYETLWQIDPAG
jgi:hypothetical protein